MKTLIDAQEPDGYLGEFDRAHRLWAFIDIQELAYLIQGLLTDYRLFKEERSLAAARKQADHILKHWDQRPAGWPEQARDDVPHDDHRRGAGDVPVFRVHAETGSTGISASRKWALRPGTIPIVLRPASAARRPRVRLHVALSGPA